MHKNFTPAMETQQLQLAFPQQFSYPSSLCWVHHSLKVKLQSLVQTSICNLLKNTYSNC